MARKPADSPKPWVDPDEGQEWTDEMFARAVLTEGDKVIPRKMGRPKSAAPKAMVTLRLDPDVIESFRAGGAGWQSRINAALREHLPQEKRAGSPAKHGKTGKRRA